MALASAGVTAAATAAGAGARHARSGSSAPILEISRVGPAGSTTDAAVRSEPGGGGGAELVTGVVQSVSAIRVTAAGSPAYSGTEPATMTVQRSGHRVVVTVVPR